MTGWKFWRSGPADHRAAARSAYNEKRYAEAEEQLSLLLAESQEDVWGLDVLGRLLMNTSRHGDALEVWERYLAVGGDVRKGTLHLGRCHRACGEISSALSTFSSMLLVDPEDDEVWDDVHKALDEVEDLEVIEQFVDELRDSEISPTAIDAIQLKAMILKGDSIAVVATACRLLTNQDSDFGQSRHDAKMSPKWLVRIAGILLDGGLPREALQAIATLDPDDPRRTKLEITARRLLGEHELASDILASISGGELEDHGILLASVRLAWDIGAMERVIQLSDTLLTVKPGDNIAIRFRLQALVKLGDIPRLREAVDEIIFNDPTNVQALRIAIDITFSEDCDWEGTSDLCSQLLEQAPDDRRALCHRAIALGRSGSSQLAQQVIEQAKVAHPESNDVDLAAAEIARQNGDGSAQLEAVNRIFKRCGYSPIASSDEDSRLNIQYLSAEATEQEEGGPFVSVIMTAFKRDELLDVAINSILAQTHHNLELIVVDDLSPDDTFEHLLTLAEKESRLKVFQTPLNGGTYLAKNLGLNQSRGDFIAFMDSDDWTHPQRIARQLEHFEDEALMGTCDAYFRIDDESHIPYRGKGATRMACISLLMRRAVLEQNGFFDALRVGADTEYIERISASFGEEAFHFANTPTMLMTQHGTSLTGGGRFHISWRSITGHRLSHHSAFRAWHKQITHGEADPYLPHPLRVRPFTAPEEMLSGPYQWNIETPLFSELIAQRSHRWWTDKQASWQAHFSAKTRGRRFAEGAGVLVPDMHWEGLEMTEIPQFEELPSRVVIKPSVGWSANNVFCLLDGVNVLDGETYDRERILKIMEQDAFLRGQSPTFMCEEFLTPEKGRESDVIPRDYKFYCYGDEIALVHVVLRRSVTDKYANVHHHLDSEFREIPRKVMSTRDVPEEAFPMPDCWDAMVEDVRALGKAMGCFMRIDMYATNKGPVFGEFTPTPEGGKGFTEWADKYLGTFWRGVEGADEGSIPELPEWAVAGGLT
jgi:tetratricopeptide (TPR) repeat protein